MWACWVKQYHKNLAICLSEGWKPMADCKEYRGPFLMSGDLPMAIIHPCLLCGCAKPDEFGEPWKLWAYTLPSWWRVRDIELVKSLNCIMFVCCWVVVSKATIASEESISVVNAVCPNGAWIEHVLLCCPFPLELGLFQGLWSFGVFLVCVSISHRSVRLNGAG